MIRGQSLFVNSGVVDDSLGTWSGLIQSFKSFWYESLIKGSIFVEIYLLLLLAPLDLQSDLSRRLHKWIIIH